jgi:hypothetical protein
MAAKVTTLEASSGWTFDFSEFTAGDFEELNEGLRNTKVSDVAAILPRIVTATPWGAAKDPATYRNVNIREFLALGKVITEALQEDTKK